MSILHKCGIAFSFYTLLIEIQRGRLVSFSNFTNSLDEFDRSLNGLCAWWIDNQIAYSMTTTATTTRTLFEGMRPPHAHKRLTNPFIWDKKIKIFHLLSSFLLLLYEFILSSISFKTGLKNAKQLYQKWISYLIVYIW